MIAAISEKSALPFHHSARYGAPNRREPALFIMPDITPLEERIAHLIRAADDLSDVVARQGREIDVLTRQVRFLLEREAAREEEGLAPPDPDERPPHW